MTGRQIAHPTDWAALALLLAAMLYAVLKPMWDWDIITYLALAKAYGTPSWGDIHAWVYALVDQLPNRHDMLARDVFRAGVATDPEGLRQNTGFYQARIGYTGLMAGALALGLPILGFVQALSLAAFGLLAVVMWRWLKTTHWPAWATLLVFAFLIFNPTVMKLARWSSPDGMVAALLVLGLYLFLRNNRGWMLAWGAMLFFKANAIIFLAPVGVWALVYRRDAALPLLGLAAVAATILFFYPNFPMAVLWEHGFGEPFIHPASAAEALKAGVATEAWASRVYDWELVQARLLRLHGRDLLVWLAMAGSVGFCWVWRGPRLASLATALFVGACLQILLFPAFWERYFAGVAVGLLLLAMAGSPLPPLKLHAAFAIGHKARTKPTNRSTRHRTL